MNPVQGSAVDTSPRPGGAAPRPPAVLVVDDEADLRDLLALTLVRLGLDVDGAESLARARALMEGRAYSLCLTDMRLPDGSGLDLVREVHGRGGPKIAVITAFGSAENAVAALKAGAFDYLTKPVDLDQLRLLVRSALRDSSADGARDSRGFGAARHAVCRGQLRRDHRNADGGGIFRLPARRLHRCRTRPRRLFSGRCRRHA